MIRQPDYDRAATQACRCLLRLQVNTLPVRPLEILRKCSNTAVYTYDEAAEYMDMPLDDFERRCGEADAFTIRMGEKYIVCYRSGGNPARLNFTLAHELGHIVLHHAEDNAAEEAEANCFARHLLCPEPAVKGKSAEEISRACFVSRAAAQMALKSKNGRVPMQMMDSLTRLMTNGMV